MRMSVPKPHSTVGHARFGHPRGLAAPDAGGGAGARPAIVDPITTSGIPPRTATSSPTCTRTPAAATRSSPTVFIECTTCYRADGPPELRTLGETKFVDGIAVMPHAGGGGEAAGIRRLGGGQSQREIEKRGMGVSALMEPREAGIVRGDRRAGRSLSCTCTPHKAPLAASGRSATWKP
jgi:hypothetical protein